MPVIVCRSVPRSRDRRAVQVGAPKPAPVGSMPATTTDVASTRGGVSIARPTGADQAAVRPPMLSGVSVDSNGSKRP